MKKLQIYLDTSIINHLDADDAPELRDLTIEFFNNYVKTGKYDVYISPIVINEIEKNKDTKRREVLLNLSSCGNRLFHLEFFPPHYLICYFLIFLFSALF
mgnify:CR=1 FL=1